MHLLKSRVDNSVINMCMHENNTDDGHNCHQQHGIDTDDLNYRALTLGSIIGKLYDAIIIKQKTGVFYTSDLQFGFKDVYFYGKRNYFILCK